MSDNDFNAKRFKKGQAITANSLSKFTDGVRAAPLRRNYGGLTRRTPSGQTFVPHKTQSSSGGSTTVLLTLKSFATGVYTADIITSPTDATVITANVKAKLLEGASNESSLVGDDVFSNISYTETIDAVEQPVYYFSVPVIK